MSGQRRARCAACGTVQKLRRDGTVSRHPRLAGAGRKLARYSPWSEVRASVTLAARQPCPGSGQPPGRP